MNNQENIKLSPETFDNVLGMLDSPDSENHVVAFSAIETADFKKNLTYVLLLKKECSLPAESWNRNAPVTVNNLKSLGIIPERSFTYKKAFEILLNQKVNKDDLQFYMNRFSKYIFKEMADLPGYENVDSLEFTIKMKENYDNNVNIALNEG